jgi:hypothetical protein
MAATVVQKASQGHYFGFDVGQPSLDYCAAMLRASGIDERRLARALMHGPWGPSPAVLSLDRLAFGRTRPGRGWLEAGVT